LEAVSYDRSTGESTVMSAYGIRADWYQNIMAHAALEVQTAGRRYVPLQRLLDAHERYVALATYERRYRCTFRAVMKYLGYRYDGTEARLRALADEVVVLGFRPSRQG
jgi:hypothetical protein